MENYFNGHTATSLWKWNSAGKTLTSTVTGIAEQEGYINTNNKGNWEFSFFQKKYDPILESNIKQSMKPDNCFNPRAILFLLSSKSRITTLIF